MRAVTNASSPTPTDLVDDFIDAAVSAGLEQPADHPDFPAWIAEMGWEGARCNGGDSFTLARLIPDDERIAYQVTTLSGVIIVELSFPANRLGFRLFETCAAVYP